MLPRSFLYVPGSREDLIEKAVRSHADALILDLEDSVSRADKAQARALVRAQLGTVSREGPELWARVNADSLETDIESVAMPGLSGILIAKCDESLAMLAASLIAELIPGREVPIIGLLESAAALRDIDRIAAAGSLTAFAVGLVDLLADLRIDDEARSAIDGIFLRIVVASAATGMLPPVAPTQTRFRDLDAFRTSSEDLLARGFRSRTAIHPTQVAVINDVFAPSPLEIERAQAVLDQFSSSVQGVSVDSSGRMVDAAVVRGAREVIERARALDSRGESGTG